MRKSLVFTKVCAFLLSLILVAVLFPAIAVRAASDKVYYLFPNGSGFSDSECTSYNYIDSNSTELNAGWYVVDGTVTVADQMECKGQVHLILLDGSSLTAKKGIKVMPGGNHNALTIYAGAVITGNNNIEIEGTGKLKATGLSQDAGIGGTYYSSGGNITINGGYIEAVGGDWAAGIGGAYQSPGLNITINGGNINAYCSGKYGAGIGGGSAGNCENLTINGGTVYAKGGLGAAGIGSGYEARGCDSITINGGNIQAYGGDNGGAGIGSGVLCPLTNFTINGGDITAVGGLYDLNSTTERANGIGGGRDATSTSVSVTKSEDYSTMHGDTKADTYVHFSDRSTVFAASSKGYFRMEKAAPQVSASTDNIDYGKLYEMPGTPDVRDVVLKNTGNVRASISYNTPSDYVITNPLGTNFSLDPGKSATISIQPKSSLGIGKHDQTLSFTYSKVSTNVSLAFELLNRVPVTSDMIDAIPDQTWTGSKIEPAVTVTDGSYTLIEGTDYTLSYESNIDIGEAKAVVSGIGKYCDSVKSSFKINEADSIWADPAGMPYNANYENTLADITLPAGYTWKDDTLAVGAVTDANGRTFKAIYKPDANHKAVEGDVTVIVLKRDYEIIEGANEVWLKKSDAKLTFKGNGEFKLFDHFEVDGVVIAPANYSAYEGSTVISLSSSYLSGLSAGDHTIEIFWKDGSASAKFAVKAPAPGVDPSPATGDDSKAWIWISLLIASGTALVALVVITVIHNKKKK